MPQVIQQSHDEALSDILRDVHSGEIQLPEFQRNWIWDDQKIRRLIASISQSYPIGVITMMKYKAVPLKLGHRLLTGADGKDNAVEELILDGQQRLTAIYCAAFSSKAVSVQGKDQFYYLDIKKCLDPNEERINAIVAVPEDRKIKTNFNRDIVLDLSTREQEYEHEMFPLNLAFNSTEHMDWSNGYKEHHDYSREFIHRVDSFFREVITSITAYKLPVIKIEKASTEAVCKIFENINVGGMVLTVFELVTAAFSAQGFNLREDWEKCRKKIHDRTTDVLNCVDEMSFLKSITLYSKYNAEKGTASCRNTDLLDLPLGVYKSSRDALLKGYERTRTFLYNQCVFRLRDLPYPAQIIPLSAICAHLDDHTFNEPATQNILKRWFWCGIFGENYSDTNYVNDIVDVLNSIHGRKSQNRTVNAAFFNPERLLTLKTRQSAAYKGILALLYCKGSRDLVAGTGMDVAKSMDKTPEIHHIFPSKYCREQGYDQAKYDSVINKTPLLAASNKFIGGAAPSVYAAKIMKKASITDAELRARLKSNLIDYDSFMVDDFDAYFEARKQKLLDLIISAMDK